MSDLDRSAEYLRKLCMIKENIVPTQSEIKYRMGDDLASALFDSILPALKPYLGLCPPLKGPGDELWLSPSDLLIGKVKLKPPLTSKHTKALTHQGILDIGSSIVQKCEYEHQIDKEKALIEKEMIIKYVAQKELREAVERAKEAKDKEQAMIIQNLKEQFQVELQYELEQLSEVLQIEQDKAVEQGKKEKEAQMQLKLEIIVQETVCRLTEQFAKELYKASKKLHQHFWHHIKVEKKKLKEAIRIERLEGEDKLEKLRAELQCENIANIMYVLANERRRCICEKQAVKNNFLARLSVLEKEQEERNERLVNSIERYESAGQAIKVREAVLFDIIKQFQKFIYFVLRAVPMQAEYLLNVEQLMIFELTKTTLESKPEIFETEPEEIPETMYPSLELLSSGSHVASTKSTKSNDIDISKRNFHNCENISRCDSINRSLKENEDLPYFLFNENLYVREDFRNMISQGIRISKSHELWSFRNDEVIEYLMNDDELEDKEEETLSLQERIDSYDKNHYNNQKKSCISVRFSAMIPENQKYSERPEQLIDTQVYTDGELSSVEGNKTIESNKNIKNENTEQIRKERSSKLELARDSLEILIQKSNKSHETITGQSKTKMKVRNSLISNTKKVVEDKLRGARDAMLQRESKLSLHVDSLELLKHKNPVPNETTDETTVEKTGSSNYKVKSRNVGIQCDTYPKSVGISHFEIIPEDSKRKISVVNFQDIHKIIPDGSFETPDESRKEPVYYRPIPASNRIYRMPDQPFRVIGDKDMKVYLESQDEFTAKRVLSFIRIFKNNPSLRDLFTEAAKN